MDDEHPRKASAAEVGAAGGGNVGAVAAGPEGVHVAVDAVEVASEGFLGEGFRRGNLGLGSENGAFTGGDGGHVAEDGEMPHGHLDMRVQDVAGPHEGDPDFARRPLGAARQRLEVEKRRTLGKACPAVEVGLRTGPDPLFGHAAAVPGKVEMVVGVRQGEEEGAVRQGQPLEHIDIFLAQFKFLVENLPEDGELDARPQFFQLPERFGEVELDGPDGQRRVLAHVDFLSFGQDLQDGQDCPGGLSWTAMNPVNLVNPVERHLCLSAPLIARSVPTAEKGENRAFEG